MRKYPWSGPRLVWSNPKPPEPFWRSDDTEDWPDCDGWPDNVPLDVAEVALSQPSRERHRAVFRLGAVIGLLFVFAVLGPVLGFRS